ncbi:CDP-diacylglycerol--glycerol-3-phosphate 3-phosphatidyltransferase [Hahella ganghwensis]|uniref:CDP-diacylglycerol--glycerol-3-phosphate 3-phosphatidyltransferase n=1 Tax=Hahella ganghwensis TaxID=286420 RepID=UPI0003763305|nr:CDP-diacylglycerol--glycerol-3-phosphate 3-phosphatidyltransferase [Hahella ganghwensis]
MNKPAVRSIFLNLPNLLTLGRLALIPVIVLIYYLPFEGNYLTAAAIFALAGFTDWLDGFLARRWNQMTPFGAFLDPVADKVIVAVALAMLVEAHHTVLLTAPAIVIIGREIVISALREWMAEMGKRASIAVNFVGKVKTTCQMFAIIALLAFPPDTQGAILGMVLLYVAAVLTLWSMIVYLKAAWPELTSDQNNRPS